MATWEALTSLPSLRRSKQGRSVQLSLGPQQQAHLWRRLGAFKIQDPHACAVSSVLQLQPVQHAGVGARPLDAVGLGCETPALQPLLAGHDGPGCLTCSGPTVSMQ